MLPRHEFRSFFDHLSWQIKHLILAVIYRRYSFLTRYQPLIFLDVDFLLYRWRQAWFLCWWSLLRWKHSQKHSQSFVFLSLTVQKLPEGVRTSETPCINSILLITTLARLSNKNPVRVPIGDLNFTVNAFRDLFPI